MFTRVAVLTTRLSLLLYLGLSQTAVGDYDRTKAWHLPERILALIRSYNERGEEQVHDRSVADIRATHEDSHPFEMGYVMSEILERYRKMVGLAQRGEKFKADTVFEMIKHLELIQRLFLEVFHLVNMLNEIGLKYSYIKADQNRPGDHEASAAAAASIIAKIAELEKIRKIEKKKRMKQMKKQREMYMKMGTAMDRKNPRPGNKWWPIDYGWEIDYKWFD